MNNPDEYNDPPRPFFEHISALRDSLVHSLMAWLVCVVIVGCFSYRVVGVLVRPCEEAGLVERESSAGKVEEKKEARQDTPIEAALKSAAEAVECAAQVVWTASETVKAAVQVVDVHTNGAPTNVVQRLDAALQANLARMQAAQSNAVLRLPAALAEAAPKQEDGAGTAPAETEKTDPEAPPRLKIASSKLAGGFSLLISVAMWGGTGLSLPFVLYFILKFIFPALTRREKSAILFFLLAGSALFTFGAVFSYFVLVKNVVSFFVWLNTGFMEISVPFIEIDTYIPIVMKMILAFGLVFQLPLLLFVLGWLGVISSDSLRRWRRFAIVLAFFLGMVLTPPDPMSQLLMACPLILLYELSIWGVRFKEICTRKQESKKEPGEAA